MCSDARILAILVLFMPKSRFDIKWGIDDIFSKTPRAMIYIGCTHGHSGEEAALAGALQGKKLIQPGRRVAAAVHGTKMMYFQSIVRSKRMCGKTWKNEHGRVTQRDCLHFGAVRKGESLWNNSQVKQGGAYLFLDISTTAADYDVSFNSNGVVLVHTNELDLSYIKWACDSDGRGLLPFASFPPPDYYDFTVANGQRTRDKILIWTQSAVF